ncbi:ATP-dependent DNA helicase RecQ [Sporolactobacillus sp. THM7-4]|nr:ATP-dependent DNA helicase RecQ [Sporolactobacillus sp. THM7-4]
MEKENKRNVPVCSNNPLIAKAGDVLRHVFGYDSFRPGQKRVISALLAHQDVFAMMPTGSGKSICYQIPGYLLPGLVLIVSPLLSLMEDQVVSLRRAGEKKVRALSSMLSFQERVRVLKHLDEFRFLFISPEMLQKPSVLSALQQVKVSLFVVDEAHCISQWGHEFRPDYMHLAEAREKMGSPVCLALTATADRRVREDIIGHLHLEKSKQVLESVDRPNIALVVRKVKNNAEKIKRLLALLRTAKWPAMVYCSSREWTEKLTEEIKSALDYRTAFYHGGMASEDRRKIQNQFLDGELDVLCCTNAFGMGINKSDVRLIVHFHYPAHLNAYLQEIGRAGRDGGQSLAVLYYSEEDDRLPVSLIDSNYPDETMLRNVLIRLDQGQLQTEDEHQFMTLLQSEGVTEVAARFILEQVKKKPDKKPYLSTFDDCLRLVKERRARQLDDLSKMRRWIRGTDCRRKSCLHFFGEKLSWRPRLCCDRCGLEIKDFQRRETDRSGMCFELNWERRLRRLLIGRNR